MIHHDQGLTLGGFVVETRATFSIRTGSNLEVEGTINPVKLVCCSASRVRTCLVPYHRYFANGRPLCGRSKEPYFFPVNILNQVENTILFFALTVNDP